MLNENLKDIRTYFDLTQKEISEILNSNPIDELYFKEWKDAITTSDITNLYQKYLSIWRSELDAVVEKIEKNHTLNQK